MSEAVDVFPETSCVLRVEADSVVAGAPPHPPEHDTLPTSDAHSTSTLTSA